MALPSVAAAGNGGNRGRASWRAELPTLALPRVTLREVLPEDAAPLAASLSTPEVQEFLPLGPTDEAGFARFIRWVRRERRAGRYVCFALVPRDTGTASGLFQLWPIEPGFGTAEMGFALASSLWGTGVFQESAAAIVDFAIDTLGVRRLECRSATANARGSAALRKLGAVAEGTLRECFRCPGGYLDHMMWSLLASEWRAARGAR
ncbi:MAG: GNAT family N-acetyltransferase [Acidobacteriota bacterium]